MIKKMCQICNKHQVTVNYVRNGKTYYRKICYHCIKQKNKNKDQATQLLKRSGYKKKTVCDRCGFKSKTPEQIRIHFRDQNSYNVSISNLRSYCFNCSIEVVNNPAADKQTIFADY
jgi:protein-arginine kinase activator protein McsA